MTERLRKSIYDAMKLSTSDKVVTLTNGVSIPAKEFVFTMKDGSPFNYKSFC